jgi:hypothetical protein
LVGSPTIGLRSPPLVEPSANGIAIAIESYLLIGKTFCIRIEVNVIIVRRKENALALTGIHEIEEILKCAELGIGRIDIGEAVIVAPSLPIMPDDD